MLARPVLPRFNPIRQVQHGNSAWQFFAEMEEKDAPPRELTLYKALTEVRKTVLCMSMVLR